MPRETAAVPSLSVLAFARVLLATDLGEFLHEGVLDLRGYFVWPRVVLLDERSQLVANPTRILFEFRVLLQLFKENAGRGDVVSRKCVIREEYEAVEVIASRLEIVGPSGDCATQGVAAANAEFLDHPSIRAGVSGEYAELIEYPLGVVSDVDGLDVLNELLNFVDEGY